MLRGALRLAAGTVSLATGGWVLRALHGAPAALGAQPSDIHAVAERSPNFHDGVFVNLEPASFNIDAEEQRNILWELIGNRGVSRPGAAIPLAAPEAHAFEAPAGQIAVNWLGHSTALLEIDGYRVLTDPVWSERCSPSDVIGPGRMHPPPVPLEALPALDAIVVSHDHYDHLDIDTILALARSQWAPFVVPLGVGAHLRDWGIPDERIIELDWHEQTTIDELTLICTPARHFSGRFLSRNATLWASWAIIGPAHRAYFGGDTGYTKSFTEIGNDHGPFDVTLMPVGAYNKTWPDIHMNPEEAVQAHLDLGGRLLVPIHWCTFRLAPHPWAEPIERLLAAADSSQVRVAVPKPGERVDPTAATEFAPWWRFADKS
jgi:L-ascorbate metabolism protein UlaG (beta-lactamase superfamily)